MGKTNRGTEPSAHDDSAGRSRSADSRPSFKRAPDREVNGRDFNGFSREEIPVLVCRYFSKGLKPTAIVRALENDHGIRILRQDPLRMILEGARENWFHFRPPQDVFLREALHTRHRWLKYAFVTKGVTPPDVATCSAERLLNIALSEFAGKEMHIGFSCGHTAGEIAREFARLLCEPRPDLPSSLVLHQLVADFSDADLEANPACFFQLFKHPNMQVRVDWVLLNASPVVNTLTFASMRGMRTTRKAFETASRIDVVVTSAGHVDDEHNMLRQYMAREPGCIEHLREYGCRCDMLWRPMGVNGATPDAELRAMTLLDLNDLARMVDERKHVLLALSQCPRCGVNRGEVLKVILEQPHRTISDLVVSSQVARQYLDLLRATRAPAAAGSPIPIRSA